ncbi:MAG: oxidoreductase [Verrucomicrobiales bacterium]|nr:oxidoreductase [Verrucomicrobiales bacterium]
MIRIGIVGCGRILAAHLRGYRLLREAGVEDFRITAMCSRKAADAWGYVKRDGGHPQRRAVSDIPGDPLGTGDEFLSDFQDTDDVEVFTDFRELIARGKIDAVNDFTTHGLHHVVGQCAIDHGKHLLSQKPLAVTIRAARRMVDSADKSEITFGVFENARQRLLARQWRWAFRSGPLGNPQMALLGNVGTWWAPNRIVAQTPWRHKIVEGGGISLDLGVHQFDVIRQVCGEIRSVTARTSVTEKKRFTFGESGDAIDEMDCDADDTFYASFETENGVTGTLFGSWSGAGTNTVLGNGPTFYGTKGRVSGNQIHIEGEADAQSVAALYATQAANEIKEANQPFGLENEFAIAQHDWLDAIRRGTQPETDGREGLIDLACAYAIVESARAGREVLVEDVLEGRVEEYQKPINEHFKIES